MRFNGFLQKTACFDIQTAPPLHLRPIHAAQELKRPAVKEKRRNPNG